MTFVEVFDSVRDWLSENWTDLGVALLTVCNATSFAVKKIFKWRSKKNDVSQTNSESSQGQENSTEDCTECEVNQYNAESDERRNQTLKISGLNGFDDISKRQSGQVSFTDSTSDYSISQESPNAVSLIRPTYDQILYKIKTVLQKTEMSNDSKIEVLKFILEVE